MSKPMILCSLGALLFLAVPALGGEPAEAPLAVAPTCEGAALSVSATPENEPAAALPGALEAQAGTCCVQQFAACAQRCGRCRVSRFDCTLDFPGCTATCECDRCE